MSPGTLEAQGLINSSEYLKVAALTQSASPDAHKKIAGMYRFINNFSAIVILVNKYESLIFIFSTTQENTVLTLRIVSLLQIFHIGMQTWYNFK